MKNELQLWILLKLATYCHLVYHKLIIYNFFKNVGNGA